MKNYVLFCCLLLLLTENYAQPPSILWQNSIGGSYYDHIQDMKPTPDGGYILTGHSQSSDFDVSQNFGDFDYYIFKIDYYGNIQWKKSYGGNSIDQSYSVIVNSDGTYFICGRTFSNTNNVSLNYGNFDVWILKLANNGNLIWEKNYGGSQNDNCFSAVSNGTGGIIFVGDTESLDYDLSSTNGFIDIWVVNLDSNGVIIWEKNIGGSLNDFAYSIQKTSDGGYILAGHSESNIVGNLGGLDAYFVKIDSAGTVLWQKHYGGSLNDYMRNIIQTKDGGYLAVGETYSIDFDASTNHGNRDYLVLKLDAVGNKEWSRCYGGSNNDYPRDVIQATDDNFVMVGESYSDDGDATFNHGSAEYWITKINQSGNIIWQKSYGGSGHDDPSCIIQTHDNDYLVAGHSFSPNDGDVIGNHGDDDIWLLKLKNEETCFENLYLTLDILYDSPAFQTSNNLESTIKITNPNTSIHYKSSKTILLKPGFQTIESGTFKAEISNCDN